MPPATARRACSAAAPKTKVGAPGADARPAWRAAAARAAGAALIAGLPLAVALGPAAAHARAGRASAPGAPQTWEVQVGLEDMSTHAAAQAFGPSPLVIRAGDTVKWTMAGPHTVTFANGAPEPAVIQPGPAPGELAFGPGFGPVNVAGPTVTFDATKLISSGVPVGPEQATFSVTFPERGVYGYVCLLHPGMRGEVTVLDAGASLPETPDQARARGQATLQALLGKVAPQARPVPPTRLGATHAVLAGLGDAFGASALRFVNGDVTVRRGGTVVWTNADPFEIHTITFTSGAPAPEFFEPRPQPSGPPAFVIPARVAGPAGGQTYTGAGYLHSGIVGPGGAFAVQFDAPAGTYEYVCVVHPFMRGTVTVAE